MFHFTCPICQTKHRYIFLKLLKIVSHQCTCGAEIELKRGSLALFLSMPVWVASNWLTVIPAENLQIITGHKFDVIIAILFIPITMFPVIIIVAKLICRYKVIPPGKLFKFSSVKQKILDEYKALKFDRMSDKEIAEKISEYFEKLELDHDEVLWAELKNYYHKQHWPSDKIAKKTKNIEDIYVELPVK